jgi:hypothetical protein
MSEPKYWHLSDDAKRVFAAVFATVDLSGPAQVVAAFDRGLRAANAFQAELERLAYLSAHESPDAAKVAK